MSKEVQKETKVDGSKLTPHQVVSIILKDYITVLGLVNIIIIINNNKVLYSVIFLRSRKRAKNVTIAFNFKSCWFPGFGGAFLVFFAKPLCRIIEILFFSSFYDLDYSTNHDNKTM